MFQTGFVLGFMAAIAVGVAIGGLLGSARLARVFGLLAASRTANRSTRATAAASSTPPPSPLEADVIAALVNLKASGAAARQATADAAQYLRRYKAPETFESLFNAAVATLRSKGATV
jgi:hypothetical protein